ncbi:MAG: C-terminal glycine zipper region [Acidobacteriota bacterium]|nr:C-terminal glycine zipper region [Acidobacteriota bacterium]
MSQNKPGNETGHTGGTGSSSSGSGSTGSGSSSSSGGGSAGSSSASSSTGSSSPKSGAISTTGGSSSSAGTGTATAPASGIAGKAKEYGQTVADAASTAKDFLSDKASVVGDKIQDLRNVDYNEVANQAKDYARQNPGQALLVAAAAGFVIGLLVRGGRK